MANLVVTVACMCAHVFLYTCEHRHVSHGHKTYEAISNKCKQWTQMAVGNADIVKCYLECVFVCVCAHASMNELHN